MGYWFSIMENFLLIVINNRFFFRFLWRSVIIRSHVSGLNYSHRVGAVELGSIMEMNVSSMITFIGNLAARASGLTPTLPGIKKS